MIQSTKLLIIYIPTIDTICEDALYITVNQHAKLEFKHSQKNKAKQNKNKNKYQTQKRQKKGSQPQCNILTNGMQTY